MLPYLPARRAAIDTFLENVYCIGNHICQATAIAQQLRQGVQYNGYEERDAHITSPEQKNTSLNVTERRTVYDPEVEFCLECAEHQCT